LFRPREPAFKQFKCPRPQCVKHVVSSPYGKRGAWKVDKIVAGGGICKFTCFWHHTRCCLDP